MKSWFRAIAAAFTSEATAQAFAGISTLALAIYTGYTIPRPSMIGALRWITYINPLRYGFESILTNEFRTLEGTCTSLVPQGPGYENILLENQVCAVVGAVPGQNFVDGARFAELSYGFKFSHTWMVRPVDDTSLHVFLIVLLELGYLYCLRNWPVHRLDALRGVQHEVVSCNCRHTLQARCQEGDLERPTLC